MCLVQRRLEQQGRALCSNGKEVRKVCIALLNLFLHDSFKRVKRCQKTTEGVMKTVRWKVEVKGGQEEEERLGRN